MRRRSALLATAGLVLIAIVLHHETRASTTEPPGVAAEDLPVAADGPMVAASNASLGEEPSDPRCTRHAVAPVCAADDPAWHALPRLSKDLVGRLLQTQQCDATQLYRSSSFNPRDLWLEPAARNEIARIAEATAVGMQRLRAELVTVKDREFAALHAAGKTFELDLTTLEGLTNLRNAGTEAVFADVDGRTFLAARASMPDTAAAATSLRQATADLCVQLARRFADLGTLEPEEFDAILAAAEASVRTAGR